MLIRPHIYGKEVEPPALKMGTDWNQSQALSAMMSAKVNLSREGRCSQRICLNSKLGKWILCFWLDIHISRKVTSFTI